MYCPDGWLLDSAIINSADTMVKFKIYSLAMELASVKSMESTRRSEETRKINKAKTGVFTRRKIMRKIYFAQEAFVRKGGFNILFGNGIMKVANE